MNILRNSLIAIIVGILLNIILSYSFFPLATKEEIKPPNGAENLTFKSQIMHMLVHHKQVMFTSSLIVGLLVGLSCFLSLKYFK
jgi:ABC-type transporter Mla maintaining outer membrane lipid asymmetry permease subunit MlaE